MTPDDAPEDWSERLRRGDPAAAEEVFARYAERLARLAGENLSPRLAARLDSADVVQSALRTFFRRSAQGEFQIDSSCQLWRLLARITLLKARAHGRHHLADKRDVRAEMPAGDESARPEAPAAEPGPDEQAVLLDQIDALLEGLPPLYAQLLQSRLAGHAITDIAQELNLSRQSVHRMLNLLQHRFNDLDPDRALGAQT
jgi:DNA-directed RNA polymerase specialized sigma24 family protein